MRCLPNFAIQMASLMPPLLADYLQFSGMHLASIVHAGLKAFDPNIGACIDLSAECEAAKSMRGS